MTHTTGVVVSLLNSVELASVKLSALRVNSMTAHWKPRQMPR